MSGVNKLEKTGTDPPISKKVKYVPVPIKKLQGAARRVSETFQELTEI